MDVNKALFSFIKIAFIIMIALLVIYGTVGLCSLGYDLGYRFFTETPVDEAPGKDVVVQVVENTSARDLSELLEERGLVRDARLFYLQLKLSAYSKSIQQGTYTLNTSMTTKEMMIAMSPQEETQQFDSTEEESEVEDIKE